MAMYQPGALWDFLNSLGLAPKKGLSQNFLIDGNILRKIVAAAEAGPGDAVLEIGPGPGALTEALLKAGAKVTAVDMDAAMAQALARLQTEDNRLSVVCRDILEVDIEALAPSEGKMKVIANLPYHITTPILTRLLPLQHCISLVVVMVQEEVARRITAKSKEADYSSLSVFSRFYSDPAYAFKVSRQCFVPVPKVDSAVVLFRLREPPLKQSKEVEAFFKLTRTAFGHRRKMLRASLKELYPPEMITEALTALGLNPLARPEELSLEEFLALFQEVGRRKGV